MAKKKKIISQATVKANRPSLLMVLEPRILYDGAGVAVAADLSSDAYLPQDSGADGAAADVVDASHHAEAAADKGADATDVATADTAAKVEAVVPAVSGQEQGARQESSGTATADTSAQSIAENAGSGDLSDALSAAHAETDSSLRGNNQDYIQSTLSEHTEVFSDGQANDHAGEESSLPLIVDFLGRDSSAPISQVVFVDTSVEGYDKLVDGIVDATDADTSDVNPTGTVGSSTYAVSGSTLVVSLGENPFTDIDAVLSNFTALEAVHFVSHGKEGELIIGDSHINEANLTEYSGFVSDLRDSLSESGDILLYGCNIGAHEAGQSFVSALSQTTGADVQASSNDTGAAGHGGDWTLEYAVGDIGAAALLNGGNSHGWDRLLAPPTARDDVFILVGNGQSLTFDPRTNDTGTSPLTILAINGVSISTGMSVYVGGGNVLLNSDGTLTFTADNGEWADPTPFTYTMANADGTATAKVTINRDTDGDGVINSIDIDDDNDGIVDVVEGATGTSTTGGGTTYDVDAQLINGNGYMKGDYVNAGVGAWGTFGGSLTSLPSGYVNTSTDGRWNNNNMLGFVADADKDGFYSTDALGNIINDYNGDFFTPGSPEEGFTVEFGGVNYSNNTAGTHQITGAITAAYTDGDTAVIIWSGVINGTVAIVKKMSVTQDGLFIRQEVTLTNISGSAVNDLYFMNNVDPDNNVSANGNYSTYNTIVSQGDTDANHLSLVTAQQNATGPDVSGGTEETGSAIGLLSFDYRARVSYGGFANRDADAVYDATSGLVGDVGSSLSNDVAISLSFDLGSLAAGASTSMVYYYNLASNVTDLTSILTHENGRNTDASGGGTYNDSLPDYLDIDADDDGIADNVEAQTSAGYKAPLHVDADGDGLDDAYDADTTNTSVAASIGLIPVDTDGDGAADYIDADSDNDAFLDIVERGDGQPASITRTADTDLDGLLDIFEHGSVNDGFVVNENISGGIFKLADTDNDTRANGSDAVPLIHDFDYRDNVTNHPPDAVDDHYTTTSGTSVGLDLLHNDSDIDGDILSISQINGVNISHGTEQDIAVPHGTIHITATGDITFTPEAGFSGLVSFAYVISDGQRGTDTANVTINIPKEPTVKVVKPPSVVEPPSVTPPTTKAPLPSTGLHILYPTSNGGPFGALQHDAYGIGAEEGGNAETDGVAPMLVPDSILNLDAGLDQLLATTNREYIHNTVNHNWERVERWYGTGTPGTETLRYDVLGGAQDRFNGYIGTLESKMLSDLGELLDAILAGEKLSENNESGLPPMVLESRVLQEQLNRADQLNRDLERFSRLFE